MIVIADMMGTLTTGSPVLGVIDWVRHHQSAAQARWIVATSLPRYLLVKAGLLDAQVWSQKAMVDSLSWLRGMTPERFEQVAEWTVEHNLWPKRREDVIERLRRHTAEGAQVTIASSVFEPIATAFARRIGVQAIGTPVRFEDGRARLAAELASSDRKVQQVLARLDVTGVDWAYGDTYNDIPLLEHAGHPVAVYPDPRLRQAALARGWEVLGELR